MEKKGQAVFEFLMTYGWAILVLLAVIGALAWIGVINPGDFAKNRSHWCEDHNMSTVLTDATICETNTKLCKEYANGYAVCTPITIPIPINNTYTTSK